jgi:hypothetical protein
VLLYRYFLIVFFFFRIFCSRFYAQIPRPWILTYTYSPVLSTNSEIKASGKFVFVEVQLTVIDSSFTYVSSMFAITNETIMVYFKKYPESRVRLSKVSSVSETVIRDLKGRSVVDFSKRRACSCWTWAVRCTAQRRTLVAATCPQLALCHSCTKLFQRQLNHWTFSRVVSSLGWNWSWSRRYRTHSHLAWRRLSDSVFPPDPLVKSTSHVHWLCFIFLLCVLFIRNEISSLQESVEGSWTNLRT